MSARRFWTADEDTRLHALYPDTPTTEIARGLGRSERAVYQRADTLGLHKSAAYLASPAACRLRRGDNIGAAHRFPKGHVPANKGVKRGRGWAPGRMKDGQFKPGTLQGHAADIVKPIGFERISKDGYLERKINNDRPFQKRWRAVHLLMWEAAHGPLPNGFAVAFKNGDKSDIRLDNLELVSRADLMRRNSVHNLPAPLPQMVQLLGALNRQINKRNRQHEEQDSGSPRSPVRDVGSVAGQGEPDGARPREDGGGCGARDRGLRESGSRLHERERSADGHGLHHAPRRSARIAPAPQGRERDALVANSAARNGGAA